MPRIPIPLQSYEASSPAVSAQRLVNMYAEALPKDASAPFLLRSTPGLQPAFSIGDGPIRAMDATLPGRMYVVSGDRLFRFRPIGEGEPEELGALGGGGLATIAVGPTAAVVCSPPNAWVCAHDGPMHQITVPDFPGAASVAYLDGYWVFTAADNSSRVFCSRLLAPDEYDALDFAYSDGVPNVVRRVVSHGGELWLLGEAGVEVWYDAGGTDFPFRRRAGGVIPCGVAGPGTVAACDNALFWLGQDGIVYRTDGYQVQRVSTHAVESWLGTHDFLNLHASAFAYAQDGHQFYVLTVAQGALYARTWVYDCATGLWHERASGAGATGRWRGQAAAQFGEPLIGDCETGVLHHPAAGAAGDAGQVLTRIVTTPPLWADGNRTVMSRLALEGELAGADQVDAGVTLEWSDNGGGTWHGPRAAEAAGQDRRVYWTRLGSFRRRMLRFTVANRCAISAAEAEIERCAA